MSTGFSFGTKTPAPAAPTFGSGGSLTFGTPSQQPAQQFGFANVPATQPSLFGTQTNAATTSLGFKPTGFGAPTPAPATGFNLSNSTFGNPASAAPATGLSFGQPTASTSFGAPVANVAPTFGAPVVSTANTGFAFKPSPTTGGIRFGTPASTGPSFGAPAPSTGLSFGAPAPSSGLSFGAPVPSTGLSFGATTTSAGLSFGAPAPVSTGLNFGATAPVSSGLSFGTPTPASTGLTFGTPTPASTGLSFGTSTPAVSTGLSFGTPASTGLSFGTAASSAGFGGTTTATQSTGLGFGTSTAAAPATAGLSFGTTTSAPSTGLSFGTATSAPSTGLSFGTATTAPATTGLSFGTGTTAPSLSLSFGTPATTSSALNLGTSTTGFAFGTATTSSGLGGLGASSTPSLTLTATSATTSAQTVGLGGIATTQSKTGASATTQKELPPKEQSLPNEILQTVEQFKGLVQEEKNRSSDVSRCCVKEYHKVEAELDSLTHQFSQVENQLINNRNLAEQLKFDTAKGLQNIEMAQRTQDTPPSLQYDNRAPLQYFLDLADNFEREMQVLKLKIDNTEKFVKKCNEPSALTSQDLAQGLKRLHETFVALAGRMQAVHSQVEAQKEVFLSLRKQAIRDNVNPFEKLGKNEEAINIIMRNALKSSPSHLASGPTPFNSLALGSTNVALAAQQAQPPSYPAQTTSSLGFGFGNTAPSFGMPQPSNSLFKPTGFGTQPFQLNTSTNFQLQKPPTGNKRGKQ